MKPILKNLYYSLMGVALCLLAQGLFLNIDFAQQTAQADAVGQMSIAVTCQAAPVQVWTSDMHYDVGWSEAVAGHASSPEVSLSLDHPVNGDVGDFLGAQVLSGDYQGHLLMTSRTPQYKMTGLLCRPYSQAHVNTYSGAIEDGGLDIAFDHEGDHPLQFNDQHRINSLNAQNGLTLIGLAGVVKSESVADGADIGPDRPDGQIIIGGRDAGIIKTILNLRGRYQNISQPVVLSMQAF